MMSMVYKLGQPVKYIAIASPRARAYGDVVSTFLQQSPLGTRKYRRVQRRGNVVGLLDNWYHGHREVQVRPDGAGYDNVDLVCEPDITLLPWPEVKGA